ncbi:MAG TPA: carboxypeptidase regulatory-like domain-containing protein [Candidatus Sulfotelmatobacter sp.]|nr:carboxypeptidase regulatory-like domain-containing protein [Candidatus Sulfotelmatobacter sp.]
MHSRRQSSPHLQLLLTILLAAFFLVAGSHTAFAQVDRAELEGTVTDPSGSVIAGTTVKVVAVDTGLSEEQKTNSKGYYRFPGMAVGNYRVTTSGNGFKTKVTEGVVLRVGQTRTLDVQLTVGAVNEEIEVNATIAPADRVSAEASTVIDTTQIGELPNNGRDWASFTLLAPFAQDDGGGDQRTIRFAGRARDDNNFSIDGVDAGGIQEQAQKSQTRLQISQDAIEEYRVNSALYDVEYGTQAGGQIDVETKHGTNNYHGTVFGYLRNSAFDARNFNDYNLAGNPYVPPFRMGQYGFTFGGPIQKGKTFFFLSYEGLRQLQSTTQTFTVPSGFASAGGTSFLQQVLTTSPQMCQIMQGYPWRASVGTINGCSARFTYPDTAFQWLGQDPNADNYDPNGDNVTAATPTTIHEDTWLVRIDHKINASTNFYGRAQRDISLVDAPNGSSLPEDKLQVINHPANYLLALEHTFSPSLFNEGKFYVNRSPYHNPQASALPFAVSTSNFVGLNDNTADIEVGTTYGFVDNLIWTRGRHAFKAGMEYRRVRLNQGQTADNNLEFASESDMIGANLSKVTFNAPWCCHRLRRNFFMPYFQDEWKVTPTLTLTAGIRWDYYGVAHEATNRTTVFDLYQFHGVCLGSGSFNTLPVPATSGPINTAPCPKNPSLYNPSYRNIDPRISLAWAPGRFEGKTVFRGGFGIYHGAAQNDDLNAGLESDTFRVRVLPPPSGFLPLQTAYEQTEPDLSNIPAQANHPRGLQRENRRDLYVETWGMTVEHEFPSNFLASIQYLGSRGVHLFSRGAVNLCNSPVTLNPVTGDCVRYLDQFYPDPNNADPFGSVDIKRDIGSSTYNGLGLSLERRFSRGLEFQARYTWSHSINDGSVGGGESSGPQNVNCLECDKGPSIFDVRHNFTVNAVYELPFGPGKPYLNTHGVLGKVVGGWQLSSISLWHTGHPETIGMDLSGGIASGPFTGLPFTYLLPDGNDETNQRPDIVPGVPIMLPGGGHNGLPLINAAAFQAPPTDANGNFLRYGNAPNGIGRALNAWQIDFALTKETRITERTSLEFAVQAFNIFNHVQLGDPGNLTLIYDPATAGAHLDVPGTFGIITTTNNFNLNNDNAASPNTGTGLPRQIQFMVRVKF